MARARLAKEGYPEYGASAGKGGRRNQIVVWQGSAWSLNGLSRFTGISGQDLVRCAASYGVRLRQE